MERKNTTTSPNKYFNFSKKKLTKMNLINYRQKLRKIKNKIKLESS